MPQVSIVLPTFNRKATLMRAVRSILAQTYAAFELIVVDDGSTDGSTDGLERLDQRIKVLRRTNAGAAAARNAGIAAARGKYLTFLDSDDEWFPNFLALTVGFLDRHPEEKMVATESLDVKPDGRQTRQDLHALAGHYVWLARRLGSSDLELPLGCEDDYLRVYQHRQPLGIWADEIAAAQVATEGPIVWYSGRIHQKYRWGYFHALWCILIKRELAIAVGPFAEQRRSCNDLEFLIKLAQCATTNVIAVPCVRKNLVGTIDAAPQLSRGRAYADFCRNYAEIIRDQFLDKDPTNVELQRIYAFRCLEAAKAALGNGMRKEAGQYLRLAGAALNWPSVWLLKTVTRCSITKEMAQLASKVYDRLESRFQWMV